MTQEELQERYDRLHEAACYVANAIATGAGGCIKGTLMEKELRDALWLKPGEMVDLPRPPHNTAPAP